MFKSLSSLRKLSLIKFTKIIFGLVLTIFVFVFLFTSMVIGNSVERWCIYAQKSYGGDCVGALTGLVRDEKASYREKNYAIWSLGQLGDERALPILKSMYTGNIPDIEPYDEGISQYELKKAIKLIDRGFNATAFVWR